MILSNRLLDPEELPLSLWDTVDAILVISPSIAVSYNNLINRHGLLELRRCRDNSDSPIGGQSKECTDQHFAQRFDGSVARAQLALTDPKNEVPMMSDGIVKTLSCNRVIVTDAPCGAGAASFSILSTIAELRAKKVLPREPLDISLLGAEISEFARSYAEEMLEELRPFFEEQGIFVNASFDKWDATCPNSTVDLVRKMDNASNTHSVILLLVANFSGFLTSSKWKKVKPQLRHLFLHGSGEANFVAWIEPKNNRVLPKSGLFEWILKALPSWAPFARERSMTDKQQPIATTYANFRFPSDTLSTSRVSLAVMPIDLVRKP